jgi:methylglutaconyl-CoA hydratase
MALPFQTIRVARDGGIVTITLARAEARNALDETMVGELLEAFEDLHGDASLRAAVLVGDGPAFCAGADIGGMRAAGGMTESENEEDARELARMFQLWNDLECPTLALAHGAALGGGTGLLAATDVAIAEAGCKIGFTEVRLGLVPAVISKVVVPAIGAHAARRWFLTGEMFDGRRAAEMGLVSEVVPDGEGRARLEAILRQVTSVGPLATREAKALVRRYRGTQDTWPTMADLARIIARLRASPEAREGLTAFLEKRDPAWKAGGP